MLTLKQILRVGKMMYDCGEGPLQTEGPPQGPVLRAVDPTKPPEPGSIRLRLVHVLTPSGDVGIQNVTDDVELAKLKAEGLLVE